MFYYSVCACMFLFICQLFCSGWKVRETKVCTNIILLNSLWNQINRINRDLSYHCSRSHDHIQLLHYYLPVAAGCCFSVMILVSNGPKEQLGAGEGASSSEEFEPWRTQQQTSAAHTAYGATVPISTATDLYSMNTAG